MSESPSGIGRALRAVPTWGWALLFAVVVCLPRLGGFGFWDPYELKIADQARDMVRAGGLFDPTAGGKYAQSARLDLFLAALGIKVFGASELGARLPIALSGVGALMAVYWAGAGLFRKRAALLGTLVLGSMAMFVLEARQLTTDVPLMAALALSMAGLGRFAWPASGRRRLADLGVGLVGLAVGYLGGGAPTGVVLPLLSLVAALVVGGGLVPSSHGIDDGTADLAPAGIGPDIAEGRSFGASTLRPGGRGFAIFVALGLGALALMIASMTGVIAGRYSALLGGIPRSGAPTHTFEALIRELGFGMFPWSAVAVFALARPLIRLDGEGQIGENGAPTTNARLAFGQLYLFLFAGLGFALSTYRLIIFGEARAICLPAIALAIGVFLDEALEGRRSEPVAGLLMGTGTMIVARDFYLAPEELASVHLFEKVKWPQTISIGELMLAVGLLAATGVYVGLAARGRALGRVAARDLGNASERRRKLERGILELGRWGLQGAVAIAVLFSLYIAQDLVPKLSTHFSFKPALESYARFAHPGDKIARYHVEGHGTGFYGSENIEDVPSQDRLLAFLKDDKRVFALVSTDDLAALDAGFKRTHEDYFVLDATSSRFLLLSNKLAANESDVNPLKHNVWMAPTPPSAEGAWQASETPPWKWRVNVSATFADSIELVGADFPETVRRPGKIALDLFFRVKKAPPSGYKIFVHFDGPAAPRVIGDHDPVNNAFPTAYWLPGEYIRDHFETDVPLMTTPAGQYTVYFGFWPGGEGKRLKVTQGTNDGVDRVRVGTIEVK